VHEGAGRPPYEHGKPFMWLGLLVHLPTRKYALHKWYMTVSEAGLKFFEVCIEDHHYFRGQSYFIVPLYELWFLFNQDLVDVSFVNCWAV
jgi:hypothetical protein